MQTTLGIMELSKVGVPPGILQNFSDVSDRSIKKIYPATKRESLAIYPAIIQLLSNYHPAKKNETINWMIQLYYCNQL